MKSKQSNTLKVSKQSQHIQNFSPPPILYSNFNAAFPSKNYYRQTLTVFTNENHISARKHLENFRKLENKKLLKRNVENYSDAAADDNKHSNLWFSYNVEIEPNSKQNGSNLLRKKHYRSGIERT